MNKYQNKPLSPHLSIYRLPMAAILSISHRISGFVLFIIALLFVWFLCAITYGNSIEILTISKNLINNGILGIIAKFIISLSFLCMFYHLLNGVRHLYWDTGKGLEIKSINLSGYIIMLIAFLITISLSYYIFYI